MPTLTLTPNSAGSLYLTAPYPLSGIGWFNGPDYGAVGDGLVDDTAALQAAITAAQLTGGRVISPPGKTYLISAQLTVSAACSIDLQGSTIKKASSMTTSTVPAILVTGNNVKLYRLNVNGNRSGSADGYGIKWSGTGGYAEDCSFSHNKQIGVFLITGDLTCSRVTASDNVNSFGSTGDGFYSALSGVLSLDQNCEASDNGRAGFVCEDTAGDGCVINGAAKRNGTYGAVLRSKRGRSSFLYFYDNALYGLYLDNATVATNAARWTFAYIEAVNQGLTAANGIATAVQLIGASFNSFGTIVSKGTPGYALAFSGGGTVGSTYNRVGAVLADQSEASNGNPGIIYAAGSASGSTHNHIGTAYVKSHTVAVNFGELTDGGNDQNTIGFLHADSCTYGVVWIGNGSYNRVETVVSRDCYTTDAGVPRALISFINTTTTTDNVIGKLDHRTTGAVTKPLYLVSYASGTSRNRVNEIHCPGGDYQTAVYVDSGTNDIHPDLVASPLKPAVALFESMPRANVNGDIAALATGQLTLFACYLPAGTKVSSITLVSGATPLNTGVNQWFALYDNALGKLAVTVDDTNVAWGATTAKTLSLTPFTTTYSGLHYIGVMVKATTPPSLAGAAVQGGITALIPKLAGLSTAGLTNPASAPNPAAAITSFGATIYAYVS